MAADWYDVHPDNPHRRQLSQVAARIQAGAVIAYPTDSGYALGCHLDDRAAADRLRRIRQFDKHHQFTLVCRDLSEISTYARVDNRQFRLLKQLTPGPYTFVLLATKELPKRVAHERRKTIGIRVPQHTVSQALLTTLGQPLISCTLQLPEASSPVDDPEEWRDALLQQVDVVVAAGPCGTVPTTVVDLTGDVPEVLREGAGPLAALGI